MPLSVHSWVRFFVILTSFFGCFFVLRSCCVFSRTCVGMVHILEDFGRPKPLQKGVQIGHFWHRFCVNFSYRSKSGPRAAKSRPRAAKSRPRAAQERPRAAKEEPHSGQERSKSALRAAKSRPRAAKSGPSAFKPFKKFKKVIDH